jgi:N-acetylneuraminic acid mutarotase
MELTNKLGKTLVGAGLAVALGFALAASNQALAQGGIWETEPPMPNIKAFGFAGVIDGKFHAGGGAGAEPLSNPINEEHYQYDPATDTWVFRAPIPTNRGGASAVVNGKIYVVGGCITDCRINATNLLEAYDPDADSWSTPLAPMPTARHNHAAVALDGKLFVVGGLEFLPFPQFQSIEVYDPDSDTWDTITPDNPMTGRDNHSAASIDGKLYVVGGFVRPTSSTYHVTDVLEVYDPGSNTWETKAPMPTPRHATSVGVIGGRLHVVGGENEFGSLAVHEVYDPITDTWSTLQPMPTARWKSMAGVINGRLYVAGGIGSSGALDILEVFTSEPDILVEPEVAEFGQVDAFTSKDAIVTISNTGGDDVMVDNVAVTPGESAFSITDWDPPEALPAPFTLSPGDDVFVTVTFFPTSEEVHNGTLTVDSDDPDEPMVSVSLIGNGLVGAVEDQRTVLETAVDDAILDGGLEGSGSGTSTSGRREAFVNMIEAAADPIAAGHPEAACGPLRSALRRVDGDPSPPDFVVGEDAALIAEQIVFLRDSLGCS